MHPVRSIGLIAVGIVVGALAGCSKKPAPPAAPAAAPANKEPPNSPVVVRGGSITFHSDYGWNQVTSGSNCSARPCYTTVNSLDTTKISFTPNVGSNPPNGGYVQPATQSGESWTMIVHASMKGNKYTEDPSNGVLMWSSDQNGNMTAASAAGFITIQATQGDSFYQPANNGQDVSYRDGSCTPAANDYCEAMSAAHLMINNEVQSMFCAFSNVCLVYIGSY